MGNIFPGFFEKSINRLVSTSFIIVLLIPIGFFVNSLYQNSWDRAEQSMLEKHHLISAALIEPLNFFITSRQQSLQMVGANIKDAFSRADQTDAKATIRGILDSHFNNFNDMVALSFAPSPNRFIEYVASNQQAFDNRLKPSYDNIPVHPISSTMPEPSRPDYLSVVFKSNMTQKPVILLKHEVYSNDGSLLGTLFSEISLINVGTMCAKIDFGVKGHCAIVDNSGQIIAHPNSNWVNSIRNISHVSIVKRMISGDSGTTEFYSPALKTQMVAGFSAIPKLGWGVMIPQPKSELVNTFNEMRNNTLLWLLAGVLIASAVAWCLSVQIVTPIKELMSRTENLEHRRDSFSLGPIPSNSPQEIKQLWHSFSRLLSGLQASNKEVKRLNVSLSHDIQKATEALRAKNRELYEVSILDHLTTLPNRRYFSHYLEEVLTRKTRESIGVIFIDVDHFKAINDQYGHEVGDAALIHLADIFKRAVRKDDVLARLGGDEFVIYIHSADQKTLSRIAESIRYLTQTTPLKTDNGELGLTLSIGTVHHISDGAMSVKDFFRLADQAMYTSKTQGRNKVTHYAFGPAEPSREPLDGEPNQAS